MSNKDREELATISQSRVRINTVIIGEPAEWLIEWKKRGIISSYTDAVIQALRSFHDETVENELKSIQIQNLKVISE